MSLETCIEFFLNPPLGLDCTRISENARVSSPKKNVGFAPGNCGEKRGFQLASLANTAPLGGYGVGRLGLFVGVSHCRQCQRAALAALTAGGPGAGR